MRANINCVLLLLTEVLLSLISSTWGDGTNIIFLAVRESDGSLTGVNFNNEQFIQFHKCLCAKEMEICTAHFNSTGLNVIIDHVESSRGNEIDGSLSSFSSCQLFVTDKSFRCSKLMQSITPCDPVLYSISYSLKDNSLINCDSMCIGFLENNSILDLIDANDNVLDFNSCQDHCYGISETEGTTIPTIGMTVSETNSYVATKSAISSNSVTSGADSKDVISTTTILTMTAEMNKTANFKTADDADDSHTCLIVGLILGAVLVVVVGIIVFFCWRRMKRLIKSSNMNSSEHHIAVHTEPADGTDHQYINVSTDLPVYANLSPSQIAQTSGFETAAYYNHCATTFPRDNARFDNAENDDNRIGGHMKTTLKRKIMTVPVANINQSVQEQEI